MVLLPSRGRPLFLSPIRLLRRRQRPWRGTSVLLMVAVVVRLVAVVVMARAVVTSDTSGVREAAPPGTLIGIRKSEGE